MAVGVFGDDPGDFGDLISGATLQQRRRGVGGGHGIVDEPGPRLDPSAAQIFRQLRRFRNGGRLGQGDRNDLGFLGWFCKRISGVVYPRPSPICRVISRW